MNIKDVRKSIATDRPVYASFNNRGVCGRVRVIGVTAHDHGEITIKAINGDMLRLHGSTVAFDRG